MSVRSKGEHDSIMEWVYQPGVLAWIKRKSSRNTSDPLWWPSILYPSWSYAATQSVFMTFSNSGGYDTDGTAYVAGSIDVMIEGCKKKISVEYLRKNMVPQKAALGSARGGVNSPLKKPKHSTLNKTPIRRVVAHYLGLDAHKSHTANWAAADPSSPSNVQLYTEKNCIRFYLSYKNKIHPNDWKDFVLAMKEAAVVLSNSNYDPKVLLSKMDIPEEERQDNLDPTPEFYVEWTSQSQTQSQKFSQFVPPPALLPKSDIFNTTEDKSNKEGDKKRKRNDLDLEQNKSQPSKQENITSSEHDRNTNQTKKTDQNKCIPKQTSVSNNSVANTSFDDGKRMSSLPEITPEKSHIQQHTLRSTATPNLLSGLKQNLITPMIDRNDTPQQDQLTKVVSFKEHVDTIIAESPKINEEEDTYDIHISSLLTQEL